MQGPGKGMGLTRAVVWTSSVSALGGSPDGCSVLRCRHPCWLWKFPQMDVLCRGIDVPGRSWWVIGYSVAPEGPKPELENCFLLTFIFDLKSYYYPQF